MLSNPSEPTLRRRSWLAGMGLGAAALATGCSAPAAQSAPAPDTPPEPAPGAPLGPVSTEDRQWLERLSWGANDSLARDFQSLGRERWLAMQLTPQWPPTVPAAVKAQIDVLDITRKPMIELVRATEEQRKAWVAMKGSDEQVAARQAWQQEMARIGREAVHRQLLRSLYAREQLQDQMGWFWFNHFSVYLQKANLRVMVGDYDETLRPLALGRFRDLLGAVIYHPAMLRYLDNDQNRAGKLNENLGRELLELHTLGVDGGYSQQDVQEMARVLTGFGLRSEQDDPRLKPDQQALYLRRGLFEFNPQRHDAGPKKVLGEAVQGRGVAELNGVLDRLARHPATARHLCRKIAVYLVADEPSPALVQKLVARYQASDGRIDQVLRELVAAPEFVASLNKRFKDPMHFVLSAVRQCQDGQIVVNTQPMQFWVQRLGEAPYMRVTPDGYPLESSAWNGQGQLTARFEVAHFIVNGGNVNSHLFRAEGDPPLAHIPPARARGELFKAAIEPTLAQATRLALSQATTPREADALWLSSPEFMWR